MQRDWIKTVFVIVIVVALIFYDSARTPGIPGLTKLVDMLRAEATDNLVEPELSIAVGIESSGTPSFTDVSPNDWFYDKLVSLASRGTVRGYEDGSFKPGSSVTRAETASLLVRAKGLMTGGKGPFSDVGELDWFYSDVTAISNVGLMNGTGSELFSPMQSLTREQASVIMVRAAGAVNIRNEQEQDLWLQGFKDRRDISDWAKPYAATAVKFGLMRGYPNQEFRPTAPINRAETCSLVWNLLYQAAKLRDGYPGYIDPYPLKPEITSPLMNQVMYSSSYTLTAKIDPESPIHELWINGKLVEIRYANKAGLITFNNINIDGQAHHVGVVSKNASGLNYSGTLALYHFPAASSYKRLIIIDKSEFQLYWIVDGFLKNIYSIAIGKDGTPTPAAKWIVGEKTYENPKGVFGPRRLRLYRLTNGDYRRTGYGIHGTDQPWVIGSKASHGCIRLRNENILKLWPQVDVGDHVITQQ